ncbi:polysaccharide biosynthesis C-terminal domain-containing protein [Faecalimonas umbilicata]|uniref:oligosaccharide flippase family protein n=1 Tax=Faecalimonas umbilicata TaxID=1912855 RepID=UPI0022E0C00D|nr:polysaccharide biosynthesis C-terminal domain-containing protein [Faecalimonas umbilicata]
MNKYKRLGKNLLLLLTGNFVTKILSFLMVPFYTSILTTSDYGTADLISTTVLLVLPFFSVLMDEAIMRFTLDTAKDKKQVFTIAVVISTFGFILAMCVSPIIFLFDTLRKYYWFVIFYYISLWLYNVFSNYVKGLDKISITTIAGVIHTFLYLGINIIGLSILNWGVYGYLLAIDLSNLFAALFLLFYCKLYRNFIPLRKLDISLMKEMIKYSVPMIPDYISWWINNVSDRYILAMFCGTSVTGIYSVAYKIPTILNSVTSIFSSAWKISSVENFGSKESINFYNRIYRLYSGFLLISSAGLIFITRGLARLLFAKGFFEAWEITPILILAYVFSAQAIFLGSIFTASKKTKTLFFASMIGAVVNIGLNCVLIPKWKGTGAAIATAIGYMVILAINMVMTYRIIKIDFMIMRNLLCYCLLIIEIISVLSASLMGIVIAFGCVIGIMLLNVKEFVFLAKRITDRSAQK